MFNFSAVKSGLAPSVISPSETIVIDEIFLSVFAASENISEKFVPPSEKLNWLKLS